MGCDIHAHSELKINGKWEHLNELRIKRNYDLFSFMAGVRRDVENDPEPIAAPRGLPDDVSFLTKFICDDYGPDGHSHSWLNAKEVMKVREFMMLQAKLHNPDKYFDVDDVFGHMMGFGWEDFTDAREYLSLGVEDARLVFWFDN